jgi:GNAT superfamily N-acetyltransferase
MTRPGVSHPRTIPSDGGSIELRLMGPGDRDAVLAFARELPPHDLLFLPRDISQPKVLDAWMRELERGALTSLLAVRADAVLGCATIVREPLSWSPHVAELRVVVLPSARGQGLGRILSEEAFALAVPLGIEKVTAQMTADQAGAIAVFETMGYRAEALLRDHVRDRDGRKHDIVVLSHDVAKFDARLAAYGLTDEFEA